MADNLCPEIDDNVEFVDFETSDRTDADTQILHASMADEQPISGQPLLTLRKRLRELIGPDLTSILVPENTKQVVPSGYNDPSTDTLRFHVAETEFGPIDVMLSNKWSDTPTICGAVWELFVIQARTPGSWSMQNHFAFKAVSDSQHTLPSVANISCNITNTQWRKNIDNGNFPMCIRYGGHIYSSNRIEHPDAPNTYFGVVA